MEMRYFFILTLIFVFIASPVLGGTLYLSGGPDISASLAGTNEFVPGATTNVNVAVENRGLIDIKIIRSDLVSWDDLPNSAKLMRVALLSNGTPMTVKSDPQLIGDVSGGSSKTVAYDVVIDRNARSGTYIAMVRVDYTYLYSAESEGQDNIRYYYKNVQEEIPLEIRIRPSVTLAVLDVVPEHLDVGAEGYLRVTLQNSGSEDAQKAVARIARNGQSPVQPTDSSVYLGDFPAGSTVDLRYKVSISSTGVEQQVYPLDLYLEYEDFEGEKTTSDRVTFGVPIRGKIEFSVISPINEIHPGEKKVIEVEYQNSGSAEVFRAQARLSAVEPFTSNDDTAYLGDLKPGESRIARYEVTADATATLKIYGMDTEIRYRDALDNSQISESMKVEVQVVPGEGLLASLTNPIVLAIVLVVVIGAGYYIVKSRRRT
jgi:hypothetical protein